MPRRPRISTVVALALMLCFGAGMADARRHRGHRPTIRWFIATAYSVENTTTSGKWSKPGTVAADRAVLPLNSRIRVLGAGRYSGEYTVQDTGSKVDGRHIDLYMASHAEAKKFGRQRVKVMVLSYGDDKPAAGG
jgi:3D (Asp-Asp-Asp) domain-containing protein